MGGVTLGQLQSGAVTSSITMQLLEEVAVSITSVPDVIPLTVLAVLSTVPSVLTTVPSLVNVMV